MTIFAHVTSATDVVCQEVRALGPDRGARQPHNTRRYIATVSAP